MDESKRCVVCGAHDARDAAMARMIIQGRLLFLCRTHAATVVAAMPKTFEQLRSMFVGVGSTQSAQRDGYADERRSPIPRRTLEDRRVLPPRPEGRRRGAGRRASDPRDS